MDGRVKILITGDLCLCGDIEGGILNNPQFDPFDGIRSLLGEDDLLVANVECVISGLGERRVKYGTLRADPEIVEKIRRLDVAILGNNHISDFGNEAAQDTRRRLEKAGITTTGWGNSLAEALEPGIVERNGIRVGFLSFSCLSTNGLNYATPVSPGVAPISTKVMRSALRAARPKCDVLVVYMHWGNEFEHEPVVDQLRVARRAIDWGADIVVGCHVHVVQTYEEYRGRWIFYGLGTFLFPDVEWREMRLDGTMECGVEKMEGRSRQSLAVKFSLHTGSLSPTVELVGIQPFMFGDDLTPHAIALDGLTFDLNALNRKQARYVRLNRRKLEGKQEIQYKTFFYYCDFIHRYGSPPFHKDAIVGPYLRRMRQGMHRYKRRLFHLFRKGL